MEPPNAPPDKMVIAHDEWTDTFSLKQVLAHYDLFAFKDKGVSAQDLEDTLDRASAMIKNYRGKYTKMSRIRNYICIGLLIVAVIIAVIVGFINDSIAWPMIILIMYMVFCYFAFWCVSN